MWRELALVLLHEQDPLKGACPFRSFLKQTPEELQKKYRLYDTVAIPLYPSAEHRRVGLRYALLNMGAVPESQAVMASDSKLLRPRSVPSLHGTLAACQQRLGSMHELAQRVRQLMRRRAPPTLLEEVSTGLQLVEAPPAADEPRSPTRSSKL